MDTGRASATPAEWAQTLRNCSATAAGQTEVVWMSSVFDFDSYYAGKLENLGKYGASTQWTRVGTEQALQEETARSHFRYAQDLLHFAFAPSYSPPVSFAAWR
jgi:hypothetical protein